MFHVRVLLPLLKFTVPIEIFGMERNPVFSLGAQLDFSSFVRLVSSYIRLFLSSACPTEEI